MSNPKRGEIRRPARPVPEDQQFGSERWAPSITGGIRMRVQAHRACPRGIRMLRFLERGLRGQRARRDIGDVPHQLRRRSGAIGRGRSRVRRDELRRLQLPGCGHPGDPDGVVIGRPGDRVAGESPRPRADRNIERRRSAVAPGRCRVPRGGRPVERGHAGRIRRRATRLPPRRSSFRSGAGREARTSASPRRAAISRSSRGNAAG
jgi:hypothetical protein